jgi:[ribosomal protein S18]-alanine N-acetyltransferase
VRLTRLRWWQIDELLPIEKDLFGVEQWSAGMFWNELAAGHPYVAAVQDGEVIGYAGLVVAPPDEAWVNNMAVRRDHQRRGIGRALLEELLAIARRNGAKHTLLEVAADNAPAQALYDSYDFDVIGLRKNYYQASGMDALVMRRSEP